MRPRFIFLYIIMLGSGLWNALGVDAGLMRTLASPVITGVGIWLFIEGFIKLRSGDGQNPRNFVYWSVAVVAGSFALEVLGVHTGAVFGAYAFSEVLQPQLFRVPVAIGVAWFTMMLATAAVVLGMNKTTGKASVRWLALAMAFVMAGLDSVLEPAATSLGFWSWEGGSVPALNYLTWFLASFIFALAGIAGNALPRKEFRFGLHAFLALAGYLILTSAGAYIRME